MTRKRELDSIFDFVLSKHSISEKELRSKKRNRDIVDARRLFFYLARNYTMSSYEFIGGYLQKNHATVIHAVKTLEEILETDKKFKKWFEDVKLEFDKNIAPHLSRASKNKNFTVVNALQKLKYNQRAYESKLSDYHYNAVLELVKLQEMVEGLEFTHKWMKTKTIHEINKTKSKLMQNKVM